MTRALALTILALCLAWALMPAGIALYAKWHTRKGDKP